MSNANSTKSKEQKTDIGWQWPPPVVVSSLLLCLLAVCWKWGEVSNFNTMRRSTLAMTVARRVASDEELLREDKPHWYECQQAKLSAPMWERYVPGSMDEETKRFLEQSVDKSDWLFTQLWHNLAKSVLATLRYSQTDINGMLGRGSMFVLSERHLREMLAVGGVAFPGGGTAEAPRGAMVDLGAGDGAPMRVISRRFERVCATEASTSMARVLSSAGVNVLEIDSWHEAEPDGFDLVACLNLLDRCERPLSVLEQIRKALRKPSSTADPGGLVLLAAVLPFSPYVEFSSSGDRSPVEKMSVTGQSFEEQVASFAGVLEREGFQLLSWTRVPYLCEGDLSTSVYVLDDAVFLLRAAPEYQL